MGKWHHYLLGQRFTIRTDLQSLHTLLHQTIQTLEQQRWLSKLLGYDFDITYKLRAQNGPAEALLWLLKASFEALLVSSQLIAAIWSALCQVQISHDARPLH